MHRLRRHFTFGSWVKIIIDILVCPFAIIGVISAVAVSRLNWRLPICTRVYDMARVYPIRHNYYSPLVRPADLTHALDMERINPGINMNECEQLLLLKKLHYQRELLAIPMASSNPLIYGYNHPNFGPGDAEYLYSMVRYFKPRRILEIGCGGSTLIFNLAVEANRREDDSYFCRHSCVEPYEQPWLEKLNITVYRSRIEHLPVSIADDLEENDIIFIDSSHVVRPQSDVVHEYLTLLGRLKPGVIVHAHDIFIPRDYPANWVLKERRLWAEQYLMEAFLCYNHEFEVIAALNWLWHRHRSVVAEAFPILARNPGHEPGSFWCRRRIHGR